MKSLINFWMPLMAFFVFSQCDAQIPNAKTETIKVYGNCGMCEKTIEKAGNLKGEAKVDWDKDSKMATITYDASKTTTDDVLKRIAAAGYDSDKFTANNEAYDNLPGCCHYERTVKTATQTSDMTAPANAQEEPPVSASAPAMKPMEGMVKKVAKTAPVTVTSSHLTEVYNAYFALKDALVATNGNAAAASAKELVRAIGQVKMDALTTTEHGVWVKYQKKLSADAGFIEGLTDTGLQREHFVSLSKNMYEVMKVIKPEATVYLDHCPMYNDGKGADWLSQEKGIRNPYYGNEMLTCGKVSETLNQ